MVDCDFNFFSKSLETKKLKIVYYQVRYLANQSYYQYVQKTWLFIDGTLKSKKKKRKILKHVINCIKKFSNLSFPLMML